LKALGRSCLLVVGCYGGTKSNYECFRNHAADALVRSSLDTAAFSLYMPTNVYCRLEKSYTCADKIVFLLGDTLVTLHWRRMFSAEIDSNLTFVGHLWRLWSGSVRYALSSCPVGIFALLCRDCSHKDRVGLGTYTKRQSQFSVCIPDISNAVRPPWLVL